MINFTEKQTENFWKKIDKTPGHGPDGTCHIWIAHVSKYKGSEYGQFGVGIIKNGKRCSIAKKAHRIAYVLVTGVDITGKVLKHRCNNKRCCNPDHLVPSTHKSNMADAAADGLIKRAKNRTTDATKDAIVAAYNSGITNLTELSRLFDVGRHSIRTLLRQRNIRLYQQQGTNEQRAKLL